MRDWGPDRTVEAEPDNTGTATFRLWTVPTEIPDDLMAISDELEISDEPGVD